MKAVCQRVKSATLYVENKEISHIDKGLVVYVGFCENDSVDSIQKSLKKICGLRIFSDSNDKLNLSLSDIGGGLLLVSNFTLYADCSRGFRPSFIKSAKYDLAKQLYDYSFDYIEKQGISVKPCIFGADMIIESISDGPINIVIDSEEL